MQMNVHLPVQRGLAANVETVACLATIHSCRDETWWILVVDRGFFGRCGLRELGGTNHHFVGGFYISVMLAIRLMLKFVPDDDMKLFFLNFCTW